MVCRINSVLELLYVSFAVLYKHLRLSYYVSSPLVVFNPKFKTTPTDFLTAYSVLQLNNDVVNVINISMGSILAILIQKMLRGF